jgi:hypothetical protein
MQNPAVSLTTFLDPWIITTTTTTTIIIIIIVIKFQVWDTIRPFPLDLVDDLVVSILILATRDHKSTEGKYAYKKFVCVLHKWPYMKAIIFLLLCNKYDTLLTSVECLLLIG